MPLVSESPTIPAFRPKPEEQRALRAVIPSKDGVTIVNNDKSAKILHFLAGEKDKDPDLYAITIPSYLDAPDGVTVDAKEWRYALSAPVAVAVLAAWLAARSIRIAPAIA